jgi:hypothetical protein
MQNATFLLQSAYRSAVFVIILVSIVLTIVLTSVGYKATALGDNRMQVELDIFSGRPNPVWELSAQESREFIHRFQALPQQENNVLMAEGLGYRGMIITRLEHPLAEYNEVFVSSGIVVANYNDRSKQWIDQNREFEKWLLQTGRASLDEALYEQVVQQLH